MQVVNRSALVPYSASQMYELVNNVNDYPSFLPWCAGAEILEVMEDGVKARIDISKGVLEKSFSTRNVCKQDREITMQLIEGPFSQLSGRWKFEPIGDEGCRISLHMKFDFSNALARVTMGTVFNSITNRMVDAFVERAETVYGQ